MLKLVLIGDVGVGKTSLIRRVFFNDFSEYAESTVGASFVSRTFDDVQLDVWDTAGQERYHALLPLYIRNANVAWVVVTDKKQNLNYWTNQILERRGNDCKIITIQSKLDTSETRLDVDCQTSAKNNVGCADLLARTLEITPVERRQCIDCVEPEQGSAYGCC